MTYAKVHEEYWDGEKIKPLSDRAALLGLYLLTGDHRNAIGCFRLGVGAISDIPRFAGWGIEGVSDALLEMEKTGYILRDHDTNWILVVNYLNKDRITGPKGAIHALGLANKVPKNSVVYQRLIEVLGSQLGQFSDALKGRDGYPFDTLSEGYEIPIASPSPLPSPLPIPIPIPKVKGARETKHRLSTLPDDWTPNPKAFEIAQKEGYDDKTTFWLADQFRDSALANGRRYADWDRAFYTWVRNAKEFSKSIGSKPGSGGRSVLDAMDQLHREIEQGI